VHRNRGDVPAKVMIKNPEDLPILARNVLEFRLHREWTQSQLAAACRPPLDRSTILKIERGDHTPSLATIQLLAKALDTSVWVLLFDSEERSKTSLLMSWLFSRASAPVRKVIVTMARRLTKAPGPAT
jgi:transcriptional regulator with XRE-family HTH domain